MTKRKANILIVEDDREIRATLSTLLQRWGYTTDTARTGEEAMRKAKDRFFNIVLLDIRLPDMNGTKLLTTMNQSLPKMIKIMITGYPSLENAVEALNLGADAYIVKPLRPEKLLALIEQKLADQHEEKTMTQEKVTEWIVTRARELETHS